MRVPLCHHRFPLTQTWPGALETWFFLSPKFATSVGDDVTVGHMVLLHGCTVGHRCLIGMGSVLLDGSVVGDDCIVAAGSLLTPGTLVPPGMLALGRPARVLRPLTDTDRKWIRDAGAVYVKVTNR